MFETTAVGRHFVYAPDGRGGGGWGRTGRRHPAYYRSSGPRFAPCIDHLKRIVGGALAVNPRDLNVAHAEDVTMALGGLTFAELRPPDDAQHEAEGRYYEGFSAFVIDVFEEAQKPPGTSLFAVKPTRFWYDYQGLLNLIIVGRYVFRKAYREAYGKDFDASSRQEQVRMFTREGQGDFLRRTVTAAEKQWSNFLDERGITGTVIHKANVPKQVYLDLLSPEMRASEERRLAGITEVSLTFNRYFRLLFPDLFRYWNTPPEEHAHYWDILAYERYDDMSPAEAAHIVRHMLEYDHGLRMDEKTGMIDPDLLCVEPNGNRFPRRRGFTGWFEFFQGTGLQNLILCFPLFRGRIVEALRLAYPWAFHIFENDQRTALERPLSYIRPWRLIPIQEWTPEDLAEAVRCEWLLEGKSWSRLPRVFSQAWLVRKGIFSHRYTNAEVLFIAFRNEIRRGIVRVENFVKLRNKSRPNGFAGVEWNPFKVPRNGRVDFFGTRYSVPERFCDSARYIFRPLEAGRIGIFEIVRKPSGLRRFELRHAFETRVKAGDVTIHDADLDPRD